MAEDMRTEKQIRERIKHLKSLGNGLGVNEKRINELEWVLGLRGSRFPKTKKLKI